jgi:hypothetical protein
MLRIEYLKNCPWENKNKHEFVLELFDQLGWNVNGFQKEVRADFLTGNDLIDYSLLCEGRSKSVLKIIADSNRFNEVANRLYEHSKDEKIPICAVTTGRKWRLYCTALGSTLDDGLFYAFDFDSSELSEVSNRLVDFLSKVNTMSGIAVTRAREIHQRTKEITNIARLLPEVWNDLVMESDEKLKAVVFDEIKIRYAITPSFDDWRKFFNNVREKLIIEDSKTLSVADSIVKQSPKVHDLIKGNSDDMFSKSVVGDHLTQDNIKSFIIYVLRMNGGVAKKSVVEDGLWKIFYDEWSKPFYQEILKDGVPKWKKDYEFARFRAMDLDQLIEPPTPGQRGIWKLSSRGISVDLSEAIRIVIDRFGFKL